MSSGAACNFHVLQLKKAPVYRKRPQNPTKKASAKDGQRTFYTSKKNLFIYMILVLIIISRTDLFYFIMCFLYQQRPLLPEKSQYLVYCPFSCTFLNLLLSEQINPQITAAQIMLEIQPGTGSWPSLWPFSNEHIVSFCAMLSLTAVQPHQDGSGVGGNMSEALILHVMIFFFPQNKSLKNKLLSGNKLCDAYAEEVSLETTLFSSKMENF